MISSGMTNFRFSIIIPVYKVDKFLRQCVDCVLNQSFRSFELILVDDGSPDDSPAICDEYSLQDSRVKVIHKPNGGLSDARNAGLEIATGEYVCFIDSDDWWDDTKMLEKLDAILKKGNADIVIIGIKKYYELSKRIGSVRIPHKCYMPAGDLSKISESQNYMKSNTFVACACDKTVRKSLIDKDNQRFIKGQLSEDIEWCTKLLLKNPDISILEEAPYVYRQQVSTSISANVGSRNIIHILDVIKRYATENAPKPLLHFLSNQYVLLITNLMRIPSSERAEFETEIKSYWWLLEYNWYPYVEKVAKVKFLGYNVVKSLLRFYYLLKK